MNSQLGNLQCRCVCINIVLGTSSSSSNISFSTISHFRTDRCLKEWLPHPPRNRLHACILASKHQLFLLLIIIIILVVVVVVAVPFPFCCNQSVLLRVISACRCPLCHWLSQLDSPALSLALPVSLYLCFGVVL